MSGRPIICIMSEDEEGASRDALVDALEEDRGYASGRGDCGEAFGGGWTWREGGVWRRMDLA